MQRAANTPSTRYRGICAVGLRGWLPVSPGSRRLRPAIRPASASARLLPRITKWRPVLQDFCTLLPASPNSGSLNGNGLPAKTQLEQKALYRFEIAEQKTGSDWTKDDSGNCLAVFPNERKPDEDVVSDGN